MRRSRLLVLGCTLASLAACSDVTVPKSGPASGNETAPIPTQIVELRGVVEMVGEFTFGLRWGERRVVLLYSETDVLMDAVGKEVIVRGKFISSGEFAVASVQLETDEDELFRSRLMAKRALSKAGPTR